jgi:hypothetical protein
MPAEPLPNLCGGSALGSAEENAHSIGVCGDVPNLPNLSSSSQQKNENGASMDAATLKICTDSRTGSAGSAEDVRSPENGTFSVPNLVPNLAEGSAEVRHNEQEELVEELF